MGEKARSVLILVLSSSNDCFLAPCHPLLGFMLVRPWVWPCTAPFGIFIVYKVFVQRFNYTTKSYRDLRLITYVQYINAHTYNLINCSLGGSLLDVYIL